jgi:hypothetical protein
VVGREVALIETLVVVAGASFLTGVVFAWFLKKHRNVPEFALRLEYIVYFQDLPQDNTLPEQNAPPFCEWVFPTTHPTYFHPEMLFGPHTEPPSLPINLSQANTACKISSRATLDAPTWEPLKSAVQFILQLCEHPLVLTVWDRESDKFYLPEEWRTTFTPPDNLVNFESHVQTEWEDQIQMGRAYTKGMTKAGFPEMEMRYVPLDHRTLALYLVTASASECWKRGSIAPAEVEGFGECFRIEFTERRWHEQKRGALITQIRAMRKRKDLAPS